MKKYYDILEVNSKASSEIIEKAYHVLAKKYHPDLQTNINKRDAEIKLREINEAYQILSNSFLREQYDLELEKEKIHQMEEMYQQIYKDPTNSFESNREDRVNRREKKRNSKVSQGRLEGKWIVGQLWDNLKMVFQNRKKQKPTREGIYAIILTILIVITVGLILWFLPFTNSFMRGFFFVF